MLSVRVLKPEIGVRFAAAVVAKWIVGWIGDAYCCYKLLILKGGSSSVAERQLPKVYFSIRINNLQGQQYT
jgi:hypothetical protein